MQEDPVVDRPAVGSESQEARPGGSGSSGPAGTSGSPRAAGESSHKAGTKAADGPSASGSRRFRAGSQRGQCRFCRDKVERLDYKEVTGLHALLRGQGRIMSRQRSGNCTRHQHMVKKAIKRARFIALMSPNAGPPRDARPGRW